jgi:putative ATPase
LAVPKHLRDTHYAGAAALGHGEGYQYAHDHPGGWVAQTYLPEARRYYEPADRGFEAELRRRLEELRSRGRVEQPPPQEGG